MILSGKEKFSDLYCSHEYENAMNLCDGLLDDDPNNAKALHDKAKIYARLKDWDNACLFLEKAINSKQEPVFFFNKSRWLINLKDYDEAISSIEKGIKTGKHKSFYYYEQSFFFMLSYIYFLQKNNSEAVSLLEKVSDEHSMWIDDGLQSKEKILSLILKSSQI